MIVDKLRSAWRAGYTAFWRRDPASQKPKGVLPETGRSCADAQGQVWASQESAKKPFIKHAGQRTVRVVFLAQNASSWSCWRSIWAYAQHHPQIVTKVVLVPFIHHLSSEAAAYDALKHQMLEEGIPFHTLSYFDLPAFAPDVVLVQNPYDETRPEGVRMPALSAMGARVVYVPYGLEMGGGAWNYKAQFDTEVQRGAWRIYSRSERHRQMFGKHCASGNGHVVVTGHPKFDGEDELNSSIEALGWIEKAAGRKIVLWTPHFSVAGAPAWSTYNVYGELILEYFQRQQNLFLLVRPHPLFFAAIRQATHDGPARERVFRERIAAMPNGALDEQPSHADAFSVSHALMADVGSFLLEYLPQDKPMLYLELQDGIGMNEDGELMDYLHVARTGEDISSFLKEVAMGVDRLRGRRQTAVHHFLYQLDKKAGERICEDIMEGVRRADPAANLMKRSPPELDQQSLRYWQTAQTTFLAAAHYFEKKEQTLVLTLESLGTIGTVVDVGCGTGRYSRVLARFAGAVQGYDFSAGLIAQAREAAAAEGMGNVRFECVAIEDLHPLETFDLVSCLGMTSCVIDDMTFIAAVDKLIQMCKHGGHVILVDTLARHNGRIASDATGYVAHYRAVADYQKVFERRGLRLANSTELSSSEDGALVNSLWLFRYERRNVPIFSDNLPS
jgi:SAM-dependent methyltransferase